MLEQIIEGCKKKDPKSQEQLYRLFSKSLFGVSLKYSNTYADAQDILHDGFMIIFDKIHQFNNKGSFEGWAKRIIINNALQKFKQVRFLEVVDEEVSENIVDVEIESENVPLEYLMKIIHELPEQYRLVFSLYVLDCYSHKEISEMLHIKEGTSKSNLARARGILKDKLDNYIGAKVSTI